MKLFLEDYEFSFLDNILNICLASILKIYENGPLKENGFNFMGFKSNYLTQEDFMLFVTALVCICILILSILNVFFAVLSIFKDGVIEYTIRKYTIKYDFSAYNPKIVTLFKLFDLNENGTLEKSELCKGLGDVVRTLDPDMDNERVNLLTEEAISRFDFNTNGTLEINEFENLIQFLIEEKGLVLN